MDLKNNIVYIYMYYTEKVDVRACDWLIEKLDDPEYLAQHLREDEKNFTKKSVLNTLHQLKCNDGVNKVLYKKKDKLNLLRDYGSGIQSLPTAFRGLVCRHMQDVDIKNCHPTILYNLCQRHDIPCHFLQEYVTKRNEVLDSNRATKMEVIRSINKKQRLKTDKTWLKAFDAEMKQIQKALMKLPEYEPLKNLAMENKSNTEGVFMSHLATSFEVKILHAVLETPLVEVAVLMYDGFMFYGQPPDDYLAYLSKVVMDKTGLSCVWTYKDHDLSLSVPDDYTPSQFYVCQYDVDVVKLILSLLQNQLLFCKNRLFFKQGHAWICDSDKIRNALITFILNTPIRNKDTICIWQNFANAERVYKAICCSMAESVFDSSLFHTTTKHRVAFENGVLDFKQKRFYTWEQVDFPYYTTVILPYPYVRTTEYSFLVDKVLEPIFNDKTELAIKYLARCMAGCIEDKNFATYMGNRNCGKGALFALLQSFGDYVSAFNLTCILDQKTMNDITAKDYYWLMELEFVRLAVSQEVPQNATLRPELIKKICSGGDDIVARRNYDRRDTTFNLDCSFFILGNEEVICPRDVVEHALRFEGSTQFISPLQWEAYVESGMSELAMQRFRIGDPDIKSKCNSREWHVAFVNLLLDAFTDEPIKINVCDIEDADLQVSPLDTLQETYEITHDKHHLVLGLDIYDSFGKKIKAELKMIGIPYVKCKRACEFRDKWVFVGLRKKPDTE